MIDSKNKEQELEGNLDEFLEGTKKPKQKEPQETAALFVVKVNVTYLDLGQLLVAQ